MTPSARAVRLALATAAFAACAWASFGCASNGPRDVAVASNDERANDVRANDERVTDAGAAPSNGYVHVARRDHGAIGLVGAKRMSEADAVRFVDRLADELEACAVRQEARGLLVPGAASLVVVGGANGAATVGDLQLAPGGAVAANALECLIAPARAATLPRGTADGAAALAVEATWTPIRVSVDVPGDVSVDVSGGAPESRAPAEGRVPRDGDAGSTGAHRDAGDAGSTGSVP